MILHMLVGLISVFLVQAAEPDPASKVSAVIRADTSAGALKFTAECRNNSFHRLGLRYKFTGKKIGRSGSSTSNQSGKFTIGTEEIRKLSDIKYNVVPGDSLALQLEIFRDTVRIAEDQLFMRLK